MHWVTVTETSRVAEEAMAMEAEDASMVLVKCTKRLALTVVTSVKFRSSLLATDLFIAGTAIKNTNRRNDFDA